MTLHRQCNWFSFKSRLQWHSHDTVKAREDQSAIGAAISASRVTEMNEQIQWWQCQLPRVTMVTNVVVMVTSIVTMTNTLVTMTTIQQSPWQLSYNYHDHHNFPRLPWQLKCNHSSLPTRFKLTVRSGWRVFDRGLDEHPDIAQSAASPPDNAQS